MQTWTAILTGEMIGVVVCSYITWRYFREARWERIQAAKERERAQRFLKNADDSLINAAQQLDSVQRLRKCPHWDGRIKCPHCVPEWN